MVVGGKGVMRMRVEREQPGPWSGTGGREALIEDARSGWKGPETLGQQWPTCHEQWDGGLRARP